MQVKQITELPTSPVAPKRKPEKEKKHKCEYDEYREMMNTLSKQNGWTYVDLWDAIPADEFTNSAIHLTPVGEKFLAENLTPYILENCK